MPTLQFRHTPLWAAVASMLRSPDPVGNLYPVDNVAIVLDIAAAVTDDAVVDFALSLMRPKTILFQAR